MSVEDFVSSLAPPVLIVRTKESVQSLEVGSSYQVGRDPAADVVVSEPRVSWRHAVVRTENNTWVFEDVGSTNGTFDGARRVQRIVINGDCTLRLGHPTDGPQVSFSIPPPRDQRPSIDRNPTSVIPVRPRPQQTRTLRIGRSPDNDIVLADLIVSRHHAELRIFADGRYEIADLGGHNGTFVNGRRITTAVLTERDIIGIGHATFHLVGNELREFVDTGDVSLSAHDLVVQTSKGKILLDHVSFPIAERSLLAVIGPSGAGKTTLLGAMTGMRPATQGSVQYDNRDLYTHYAELRHRIGLVPQEDILHTQLTLRRALRYAAELRFPGDTDEGERNRRVDEVIHELGLTPHAQTRIDSLSGGQRKRVSVALELLTKPSILFLDEPTSGLDPGLDKSVMEMMRDLAHDGRTVIVVTHSVANLDVCDRLLVLVPGGRVAFYGPPQEGLRHFDKPGWAEVFQAFDREPQRDWAAEFRMSPLYAEYVAMGLSRGPDAPRPQKHAPPPRPQGRWAQLSTLCRRYLAVIGSDRSYLGVLALMPVVVGLLIRAVPAKHGLAGPLGTNDEAISLLLVLIIGACFVGAANSVRELVKERAIYRRERAAGLSAGVYLWSKLLILGLITGVQAVLLVVLGLIGRELPKQGAVTAPFLEIMLSIGALAIVSMAMGLIVSAVVSTSEKTMPLLVLLSMAQVILSGALIDLPGKLGLEQLAWLSPSRWGMAAASATVDLSRIQPALPDTKADALWKHDSGTWLLDMGIMAALGVVFIAIAWWRLELLRPGRRSARL